MDVNKTGKNVDFVTEMLVLCHTVSVYVAMLSLTRGADDIEDAECDPCSPEGVLVEPSVVKQLTREHYEMFGDSLRM